MTCSQTMARPMTTTCLSWRLRDFDWVCQSYCEQRTFLAQPETRRVHRDGRAGATCRPPFSTCVLVTTTCYHVIAAKMAVGLPIGDAGGRKVSVWRSCGVMNANELTRRPAGSARMCVTWMWYRQPTATMASQLSLWQADSCNWHTCCDIASTSAEAWITGVAARCSRTGCCWRHKPWCLRDLQPSWSTAVKNRCGSDIKHAAVITIVSIVLTSLRNHCSVGIIAHSCAITSGVIVYLAFMSLQFTRASH